MTDGAGGRPSPAESAPHELADDELKQQRHADRQDREAMSNIAIPVDAVVAANVLSDDSGAFAVSDQDVDVDQAT